LAVLAQGTCVITPYHEIEARHGNHPWFAEIHDTWIDEAIRRDPTSVYYAPRGVSVEGDLDLDQTDCTLLFVNGDLKVSGLIRNLDSDQGIHLAVAGNVETQVVIAGGSLIHVAGDLHAQRFVYGHYNDGALCVAGRVHTPYWISDDHDMRAGLGFEDTLQLHSHDGTFFSSYADYERVSLFRPGKDLVTLAKALYTAQGNFDPLLLYQHLCAGKPVSRLWEDWGPAYVLIRQWVVACHARGYSGQALFDDTQALLDELAALGFDRHSVLARIRGDLLDAIKDLVAQGTHDRRILDLWAMQTRRAADALPPVPAGKMLHEFDAAEEAAMDFCRNQLNEYAWYVYEKADSSAVAAAVVTMQRVHPWLVTYSNAWHTADTLVRLLLKLDRAPEAYAIVTSVLEQFSEEPLFRDIADSSDYKAWKRA
jgi:hypothetical protein